MGNKHLSCRKSSPRLVKYDYSSPGLYFITICTGNHLCYFGKIENGKMILNEYGQMAVKFLEDVPCHYKGVKMDEFVVMPNHIHAIIDIVDVGTEHCSVPMFANGTCSWIEPGLDTESGSGTEHCSVPTADMKCYSGQFVSKEREQYKNVQ